MLKEHRILLDVNFTVLVVVVELQQLGQVLEEVEEQVLVLDRDIEEVGRQVVQYLEQVLDMLDPDLEQLVHQYLKL